MTYIPRRVRERQKWFTLKEAISHIMEAEKCTENAAWEQLRAAQADGAVLAIWALTEKQLNSEYPYKEGHPVYENYEFSSASIDLEREIICWSHGISPSPIDSVWVLKAEVVDIWKDQTPEAEKEEASDEEIREAFRAICRERKEAGKQIPNVVQAPALIVERLSTKRVFIKVAQGVAGEEEFAKQRLRGRRRRKR